MVRSSPRLFLPRFECSSSTCTSVLITPTPRRQQAAHGVAPLDVLDLDDLGTPVGEQRRRRGHEGVLGDLEDPHPFHDGGHLISLWVIVGGGAVEAHVLRAACRPCSGRGTRRGAGAPGTTCRTTSS